MIIKNKYIDIVKENFRLNIKVNSQYITVENKNQPKINDTNNNPAIIIVPIALRLLIFSLF